MIEEGCACVNWPGLELSEELTGLCRERKKIRLLNERASRHRKTQQRKQRYTEDRREKGAVPSEHAVSSYEDTADGSPYRKYGEIMIINDNNNNNKSIVCTPLDIRLITCRSFCSGVFWQRMENFQFLVFPLPANFSKPPGVNHWCPE